MTFGHYQAVRAEKSRTDRAEARRLFGAGYTRVAIQTRLSLARSTVDRHLEGLGQEQPPALAANSAAQSAASIERDAANREAAQDLEARGFDRNFIALRLKISRRRVGELLGPKQKEKPPMNDKTEPVGNLPTWISPTVKDYERDTTPADAPDTFRYSHSQDVVAQALKDQRKQEAAFWGIREGGS